MTLVELWFILIGVLFTGYLVLEGFDFGVGMLLHPVGRNLEERRQVLKTIGPVWDGNEVWLLTAGGAIFAAFPEWYATLFSGYYLALFAILMCLIVRVMALEYRNKHDGERWRRRWDLGIAVTSILPAFLWGVAFANIVGGSPLNEEGVYVGGFWDLIHPYAILGGLVTLLLFALHGAHYLALRSTGPVRERANRAASLLWLPTVVVVAGFAVWTLADAQTVRAVAVIGAVVAALALIAVLPMQRQGREGWAFGLTSLTIIGAVTMLFGTLFPNAMVSSNGPETNLTLVDAASTHTTLVVMTIVALVMTPIVLAYQAWTYWVFRARVTAAPDEEPKLAVKWLSRTPEDAK